MSDPDLALTPLARLVSAYAGRAAGWHRLVWAYDARLADIIRATREPMIGRMRLTWWHEALSGTGTDAGRGEPLVEALRARHAPVPAGLLTMIDGWEALLDQPLTDEALTVFATARGGGLFNALAGTADSDPELERAGALWALWDLSGHAAEPALSQRALAMARDYLPVPDVEGKPLRMLSRLAARDVARGRAAPPAMTAALYARLLRIGVVGR